MLTQNRPGRSHDAAEVPNPPPSDRPAVDPGDRAAPLLALVALTLASAAGFARVFSGHSWIGPVMATALGAHAAAWAVRRARLRPLASAAVNAVSIGLLATWTVVPSATFYGFPIPDTWRAVQQVLSQAGADFTSAVAPVAATAGFKLLAVGAVGVTAALADTLAFRVRSGLQAIAPGFALFVVCCVSGGTSGREWAVSLEVVALAGFLLVHHLVVHQAGRVWFANRRAGTTAAALTVGAVAVAGAVLAAVVVTPALSRTEGLGAFGWKGGPGTGGTRQVESPIVSLHTRLIQEGDQPVFTVTSDVPSYWRLTTLDEFRGDVWEATNSYQGVGSRLPGTPRVVPPGTRQVTQVFHIQQLESIWLPMAFTPVSVRGGGSVSYDAQSGSLLTSHATSDAETYSVTSLQYLATLDPAKLAAIRSVPTNHALDRYLQLPPLPPEIAELAARITAGQTTEYGKAMALQAFFHTPAFHYDLNPPNDGFGQEALETFLFSTRDGYCQQFAGAYAVLARAAGLPTRLAVGFTTGTPDSAGVYHVKDADAHTWPEVNFPGVGWVPFEPTKSNFQIPGTEGYAGNTNDASLGLAAGSTPTTTTPDTTVPASSSKAPATSIPHAVGGPTLAHQHRSGTSPVAVMAVALAAMALAALAVAAMAALGRTLRWQRRRRRVGWPARAPDLDPGATDPDHRGAARVLVVWEEVVETMTWWGPRRHPDETYPAFARRASTELRGVLGSPADLWAVARWADQAAFSGPALPGGLVANAANAGRRLRHSLQHGLPAGRRLRQAFDLRAAWFPVLVQTEPSPAIRAGPLTT